MSRFLLVVLALAMLTGSPPMASDSAMRARLPLTSVLVRAGDVFASNQAGLFRASKSDRQWHQLSLPKGMPADGYFADESPDATDLWYYASRRAMPPAAGDDVAGLYHSADDGEYWQLVTSEYDFRHVLLHPSGVLYGIVHVVAEESERAATRDRIVMSRDQGRSWSDITGKLGPGVELVRTMVDPDHPSQVAMQASCERGYIAHAEDEHYGWQLTREGEWYEAHMTDERFFHRTYYTMSALYVFPADLSNYFQHDFGSRTDLPAFDIVPSRPSHSFAAKEPKVIQVTVRFLLPGLEPKLIDRECQVDFWGLRVVDPKGKRVRVEAPRYAAWYTGEQRAEELAQMRKAKGFGVYAVATDHPYLRSVDIGQLYPFDQKGVYRVQLQYNGSLADAKRGEWPGGFTSGVFEVVIR